MAKRWTWAGWRSVRPVFCLMNLQRIFKFVSLFVRTLRDIWGALNVLSIVARETSGVYSMNFRSLFERPLMSIKWTFGRQWRDLWRVFNQVCVLSEGPLACIRWTFSLCLRHLWRVFTELCFLTWETSSEYSINFF